MSVKDSKSGKNEWRDVVMPALDFIAFRPTVPAITQALMNLSSVQM